MHNFNVLWIFINQKAVPSQNGTRFVTISISSISTKRKKGIGLRSLSSRCDWTSIPTKGSHFCKTISIVSASGRWPDAPYTALQNATTLHGEQAKLLVGPANTQTYNLMLGSQALLPLGRCGYFSNCYYKDKELIEFNPW